MTWVRPYKMVRGLCPRDWIRYGRGARTAGNAGAIGQAGRVRLTRPAGRKGNGDGRTEDGAPYGGRVMKVAAYGAAYAVPSRLPMVRGRCPRDWMRWVVDAGRAHRGKHGQNRSALTDASNPPRRSRERGAPRTVHPTGGCVSNAAAYNLTGVINYTSRLR